MAEASPGKTDQDNESEQSAIGTGKHGHEEDSITQKPDVRPKQKLKGDSSSAPDDNNDDKHTATTHPIITALSIDKSQTIDHHCVEFVTPHLQTHDFSCTVCKNLMLDPLAIKGCLHSICEPCYILQSHKEGPRRKCQPGDRGPESHIGLTAADVTKVAARHLKEIIHRTQIYCPNKEFGCTSIIVIVQIREHLSYECVVANKSGNIDDIANNILASIPGSDKSDHPIQKVSGSSSNLLSLIEVLQTLSLKVKIVKDTNVTLKKDLKEMDSTNISFKEQVKTLKDEGKQLEKIKEKFTRIIGKNEDEINTLKNSALAANAWRASVNPRDPQRTQSLLNKVTLMNNTINELDLRLQCQENASFDGELMWKISSFIDHLDRSDSIESLFSQPFYDSVRGYKMCCRIYLKGKGSGRDTHVSLYFVLMRGTYDELLQWPFQKRITLTLKNFNGEDITRQIIPDVGNRCYRKPITETNLPVGIPEFVLRTEINNYLRNGSLYILCKVD